MEHSENEWIQFQWTSEKKKWFVKERRRKKLKKVERAKLWRGGRLDGLKDKKYKNDKPKVWKEKLLILR